MADPKNILIVDDHALIRSAISDLLQKRKDYNIFTAESGYEALAYADEYPLDLILMDIIMPEKDGIETTKELLVKYPDLKVLVLTGAYNQEDVFKILEAGAYGYILKDSDEEEIQFAVSKVLKKQYYFGSKSIEMLVSDIKGIVLPRKSSDNGIAATLTAREKEIIKYIAQGKVNKDIAEKLYLSKRTVDKHRTNILKKLDMNNSAELIAFAVKHGIVD